MNLHCSVIVCNPSPIETSGYCSTGQTEAEKEELALRCPILQADRVMNTVEIRMEISQKSDLFIVASYA